METMPAKKYAFFPGNNHAFDEYMLVIEPDERVREKVMEERKKFQAKYGEMNVDCTKIYIKVATFSGNEGMEETMIRWVSRICSGQQSFELSLNNYSGFPEHSIYLRIQEMEPLQALYQQLRIIDSLINVSGPLQMAAKPNVAIARQLSPEIYRKAMTDYSRKTFHESFKVNQMLLIKIDPAYGSAKLVNVFGFNPAISMVKN